jgi:glutathione peroxidase
MDNIYNITIQDAMGQAVSFEQYKGKVVLVVNVASKCGFTPQYEGLEQLYKTYHDRGFVILGFPSNQFASQEPGSNEEIQQFCKLTYDVTFPVMAKIDVNGDEEHPLFTYLKQAQSGLLGSKIKWNFTKFLIDREGNVVKRYAPTVVPEKLNKDIERYLG